MIATFLLAAAFGTLNVTADRIAADPETGAVTATGNVVAVAKPLSLRGQYLTRDADGKIHFHHPACVTTCSNDVGHTHWSVEGEVEYAEKQYVILRDMKLRFFEIPILWLPYFYYPMRDDCGFSYMPGYMGRWGAYLLTKYTYHLLGDPDHAVGSKWLTGATRFDMRWQQGLALGEDLEWDLGDFGRGEANFYYAWDQKAADNGGTTVSDYTDKYHSYNWESPIDEQRYMFNVRHALDLTERDTLRMQASVYSDSSFRGDFVRKTALNWKGQWAGYENSGVFWEHVENAFALGAEVSGRLNDFYGMTDRLPEIYLDVHPVPVFGLPVNYETENRIGYLRRDPAERGGSNPYSVYSFVPGRWAYYDAARFDTYHRLTLPLKFFDVLSAVPRIGYRGTYWSESGEDCLTGHETAGEAGALYRSILEGGATFSARGTGWIDERWRHMVEPYFDVLAQEAWMAGPGNRPYVFDNLDASVVWEDQFAGRSRNLPYSYYGVTPGLRNAWEAQDERGRLHQVVDFDVYAALQFANTAFEGANDEHKIAEVGKSNYGKHGCEVVPGARLRWTPCEDIMLMTRAEYDSDYNTIATADAGWRHKLNKTFSYEIRYGIRDYRVWDFSSAWFDPDQMAEDRFNSARFHFVNVGFENQPLDWFAWGPFLRWDIRENELDTVGTWFDLLTDCLGFRFIIEYENAYTRPDGFEWGDDWSFGFYIYLRAFGPNASGIFSGN